MPTRVPPQLAVYHCTTAPVPIVPPEAVRVIFVATPEQTEVGLAVALVGATELVFIVILNVEVFIVPQGELVTAQYTDALLLKLPGL